jgi:Ca2+-binding EF-hand superfamily protein/predicted GNAT family acetyltransferase
MNIRLRLSTGQEYAVDADSSESIGDVKSRVEKIHGIDVARQRIFHMGRELSDSQELRTSGITAGQPLQLALRTASEVPARRPLPQSAAQNTITLRLRLPGGDSPAELRNVPVSTAVLDLKHRVQKDHGIRYDHLSLSFFGRSLQDADTLEGVGIASGGLIDISLCPPLSAAVGGKEATSAAGRLGRNNNQADLAGMQTSVCGRILTEDEALEAALSASKQGGGSADVSQPGALPVDDGSEDEGADSLAEVLVDVSLQDEKLQAVLSHARRIASSHYREDFISKVSKRSGYRLTLLVEKSKKPKKVFGYAVYRFRQKVLNVIQLAVAGEQRGRGMGCHMVRWLLEYADKSNMTSIALACTTESVDFYQRRGFIRNSQLSLQDVEIVDGQVYVEYGCKKGSAKTGSSSAPNKSKQSREDLVKRLFSLCDVDRDGYLNKKQMHEFAQHTGFDGSDEDWAQEFQSLCSFMSCTTAVGIDPPSFARLVDDESDQGCYCTDAELQDMIAKLERAGRTVQPATSSSAKPAAAASLTSGDSRGERKKLIDLVFSTCDRDRDSILNVGELRRFAILTGFDGDAAAWESEFNVLCSQYAGVPSKVDLALFTRLVQDESDDGCYCTDSELQDMLKKLRKELVRDVFSAMDCDCDGTLSEREMRVFAQHTGFDGDDASWAKEYGLLCSSYNGAQSAISLSLFEKLVDDETDDGCFCTNEELRDMLLASRGKHDLDDKGTKQAEYDSHAQKATAKDSAGPGKTAAAVVSHRSPRSERIEKVFRSFDRDGDGFLSQEEMQRFARHTGFDGSDADWANEYSMLCSSYNGMQSAISLVLFEKLVEDDSEDGCYCTDGELEDMLSAQQIPREMLYPEQTVPSPHPPSGTEHIEAVQPVERLERPVTTSRSKLIKEVFHVFDADRDGYLNSSEMRRFAGHTGFDGNDAEWAAEYRVLCSSFGGGQGPISSSSFEALVEDSSEDGCYCTDDELKEMMAAESTRGGQQQETQKHPAISNAQPPGLSEHSALRRSELVRKIFNLLDKDGDSVLNEKEMRPFAAHTGFDGNAAEWAAEYRMLCSSYNGFQPSISLALFEKLVDDQSEDGCYCTDEEIQVMVLAESEPSAKVPPSPPPAAQELEEPKWENAILKSQSETMSESGILHRPELVRKVFKYFDRDGDGLLNEKEMRPFAAHTGFDGTDADWATEYRMLCSSYSGSQSAISLALFAKLIDDQSEDGCYCTDQELSHMLSQEQVPYVSSDREIAICTTQAHEEQNEWEQVSRSEQWQQQEEQSEWQEYPGSSERTELITKVFKGFNVDGDGFLNSMEMRRFAGHTGFDGDDAAWKSEFQLLCSAYNGLQTSISLETFKRLVNDESDDGCYCTDEELMSMLQQTSKIVDGKVAASEPEATASHGSTISGLPATPPVASPPQLAPVPLQSKVPVSSSKMTRNDLIHVVFRACDDNGDGFLSQEEMHQFATYIGFQGSDEAWAAEFKMLCEENGSSLQRGVDPELFLKLVEDQSDKGCYCTTKELKKMVQTHFFAKVRERGTPMPQAQQPDSNATRQKRVRTLFKALDSDEDGFLNVNEMKVFAEFTGFSGTDDEWTCEFPLLFDGPTANPAKGVDFELFARLVDNTSEAEGCYCTDAELAKMLKIMQDSRGSDGARAAQNWLDNESEWQYCTEASAQSVAQMAHPSAPNGEGEEWGSWGSWREARDKAGKSQPPHSASRSRNKKMEASWTGYDDEWSGQNNWWVDGDAEWWHDAQQSGQEWQYGDKQAWSSWQSSSHSQGKGRTNGKGKGKRKEKNTGW